LIQEEKIVEGGVDRVTRCRTVIEEAKKGKGEIAISGLCLAEVCKNKDQTDNDPKKISAFFEHEYILVVSVDRSVGEKARELMMAGIPKLRPQDACHLATALLTPDVMELHTFDERLLRLNGALMKADGTPLKICWPDVAAPPPPLLADQS
jgi:predicted nucleic acid-binding protein